MKLMKRSRLKYCNDKLSVLAHVAGSQTPGRGLDSYRLSETSSPEAERLLLATHSVWLQK